jgi:KipI family sensor histidine kinase inhibitor
VTDRGLRIASGKGTLALYHRLAAAALPGVAELVPADGSLLVILKPGAPVPAGLADILSSHVAGSPAMAIGVAREIRVRFDGEDLPAVAARVDLPVATLVEALCRISFRVQFLGFQPGFAYLAGLPAAWRLPRRDTPRTRVPAGSLALGGAYCGIYPVAGPGGWHLLGHTDAVLFDPASSPPALLQPGDKVRLVRA